MSYWIPLVIDITPCRDRPRGGGSPGMDHERSRLASNNGPEGKTLLMMCVIVETLMILRVMSNNPDFCYLPCTTVTNVA